LSLTPFAVVERYNSSCSEVFLRVYLSRSCKRVPTLKMESKLELTRRFKSKALLSGLSNKFNRRCGGLPLFPYKSTFIPLVVAHPRILVPLDASACPRALEIAVYDACYAFLRLFLILGQGSPALMLLLGRRYLDIQLILPFFVECASRFCRPSLHLVASVLVMAYCSKRHSVSPFWFSP